MNRTLAKLFFIFSIVIISCLIILKPFIVNPTRSHYLLVLTGIFIALALSLITGFIFLRPIGEIRAAVKRIIHGDFPEKVTVASKDELKGLADDLNQVSTNFRRQVAELVKDKSEFEAILSSMVEGVIVIGKDEKILLLSAPVSQMFDLRSKEAVGRPYWEVIRNEEINALLQEATAHKKAIKREFSILFPEESHFSIQISPILDQDGGLSDLVAVFHDITELKKLEKIRTEFVANVSHELKTPLTSIKGYVETLKNGALEDPKTARKFLDIIQSHSGRLENLISDLLALSSVEAKDFKGNFEPVSVASIIETVTHLLKDQVATKHLDLCIDIPAGIPTIPADKDKIDQVFLNLIDNAIKFTQPEGKIVIRAREENTEVRIDVEDSGIGIPAEHLPRVFERFYRVDKSRSRELGGTGLGLSIVKHIVQSHNGRVAAESKPGKGSVFSVFLPKYTA